MLLSLSDAVSVEAYDAFSLSPVSVVARVRASPRTSISRISSATASAVVSGILIGEREQDRRAGARAGQPLADACFPGETIERGAEM